MCVPTGSWKRLPAQSWRRLSVGAGSKGGRPCDWALTLLWRLQITPSSAVSNTTCWRGAASMKSAKQAYYVVYAPSRSATRQTLANVVGRRWEPLSVREIRRLLCRVLWQAIHAINHVHDGFDTSTSATDARWPPTTSYTSVNPQSAEHLRLRLAGVALIAIDQHGPLPVGAQQRCVLVRGLEAHGTGPAIACLTGGVARVEQQRVRGVAPATCGPGRT